ncbi:MAG: low molecular weight phosphatase family protein [Limnospira sp.]
MKTILFLSASNDYRSRFSESLFNHLARKRGLNWRAYSRGLSVNRLNQPIAREAISELTRRGIPLEHSLRSPRRVSEIDFKKANKTIAIEESTDRPLMRKQYPSWANSVEYWNVSDGHVPSQQLEHKINQLIDRLVPTHASLATAWMGDDY